MRYIETWEVRRMTHSQESRVSSSQDALLLREENRSSVSSLVNEINSCLSGADVSANKDSLKVEKMAATSNQEGKKQQTVYPWLSSFGDACRSAIGCKSTKKLERLITMFLGHVSVNVKECYTRPNRAAKLRKCISETLSFFHLYYQDVREESMILQSGKRTSYLNLMTELVSIYMDMEIKAACRRKETLKKITSRLTSALYIFLDRSEDHVLDAILKAKLINKHNSDVCLPLLGKVVNQMPLPLSEMSYVRYLLIFKLFKRVMQNSQKEKQQKTEEKERISKLAILKLKPPANFAEKAKIFTNVLPKIPPKSKKNITHFFMQAKINLKSACAAFLKGTKEFQESLYGSTNKDLLSSKQLSVSPIIDEKLDDGAGHSNGLCSSDMWASLHMDSFVQNSQLRDLTSSKKDAAGKKVKEKVKKKKKKNVGAKDKKKDLEKVRKKKLKKNKILGGCGDTISMLENKIFGSKKGKGDKKKKKKITLKAELTSSESTDESVSLPETSSFVDTLQRELEALRKLPTKSIANMTGAAGASISAVDNRSVVSTGKVQSQEINNDEDMLDISEVAAETSASVLSSERPTTTMLTSLPPVSSVSAVCTVVPPPPPLNYTPPPPPPTPPTVSLEQPTTTTPQGGPPPPYLSPADLITGLHLKRNTDSRSASPTIPGTHAATSPLVSVCSSSVSSPRRNVSNTCSALPAGFSPSIPPPPLPSYPPPPLPPLPPLPPPPTSSSLHTQPPVTYLPPLPSSPAPLQPPLPRSPAPPLPPLPSAPIPTSFALHPMSVPPPLSFFATIPPPPTPPSALSPSIPPRSSVLLSSVLSAPRPPPTPPPSRLPQTPPPSHLHSKTTARPSPTPPLPPPPPPTLPPPSPPTPPSTPALLPPPMPPILHSCNLPMTVSTTPLPLSITSSQSSLISTSSLISCKPPISSHTLSSKTSLTLSAPVPPTRSAAPPRVVAPPARVAAPPSRSAASPRAAAPPARAPAPPAHAPTPPARAPASPRAPAFPVHVSGPSVHAPAPTVHAPAPPVRTPAPSVRTTVPPVRAPVPSVHASALPVCAPSLSLHSVSPSVRASAPSVCGTAPSVRASASPVRVLASPVHASTSPHVLAPPVRVSASTVRSSTPPVRSSTPPVRSSTPPVRVSAPTVRAPTPPVLASASPICALAAPVRVPASPVCAPDSPACSPDSPVCAGDTPVCAPDSPICSPDSPVCSPDSPVCSPDSPVCAPDSPVCAPDSPVCVPDSPVRIPSPSGCAPLPPCTSHSHSLLVAPETVNTVKTEIPTDDQNTSVTCGRQFKVPSELKEISTPIFASIPPVSKSIRRPFILTSQPKETSIPTFASTPPVSKSIHSSTSAPLVRTPFPCVPPAQSPPCIPTTLSPSDPTIPCSATVLPSDPVPSPHCVRTPPPSTLSKSSVSAQSLSSVLLAHSLCSPSPQHTSVSALPSSSVRTHSSETCTLARSHTPPPSPRSVTPSSLICRSVTPPTLPTCTTITSLSASTFTATVPSSAHSLPTVTDSALSYSLAQSALSPSSASIAACSSATIVCADTAVSVTMTDASPVRAPSPVPPVTCPSLLLAPPSYLEQPTTTTTQAVDSPSKIIVVPTESLTAQHSRKRKHPCESASAIPCFSFPVIPSEERLEDLGAEVEVVEEEGEAEAEVKADTLTSQVVEEEAEAEVEADSLTSQVVEEAQENMFIATNRVLSVKQEPGDRQHLLLTTLEVCSEEGVGMCIKEEIPYPEDHFNAMDTGIAPLAQTRNTVISTGSCDSVRPSSSGSERKCSVASQICKEEVQGNEAIASCSSKEDKMCMDTVSPRLVRDVVLVSNPISKITETETVPFCDSSVENVPLSEVCPPVSNEDMSTVPMDVDFDAIDTQVPVEPSGGFSKTNDEFLTEMLNTGSLFGVHNVGLGIIALDFSQQDESEEVLTADTSTLYNYMLLVGGGPTNCATFGHGEQSSMIPIDRTASSVVNEGRIIMVDDVIQDEVAGSSDDNDEDNKSHSSDYNRYIRRPTAGKQPPAGFTHVADTHMVADVSDASSSSSVESESVLVTSAIQCNSTCSDSSLFSHVNDRIDNGRERRSHQPETSRSNSTSKQGRLNSLTQTLQSRILEDRKDSSSKDSASQVMVQNSKESSTRRAVPNGIYSLTGHGGFSDVLDVQKAEGQRQEPTKPAQRGMLLDTTGSRGKMGRPYVDTMYRGVPLQAPAAPTSIPYPAITNPMAIGKGAPPPENTFFRCTCSECYANHLLFLSGYGPIPPGGPPLPLSFHDPHIESDTDKLKTAEKLKSEDEELLRRIEEALAKDKLDEILDSKYRPELDSSLPPKKRLKTIAAVSNIKSESREKWESPKEDSFPSYPTKPMISIAELDFTERLFSKHVQRPIKTVMSSNPQRYLPYAYFQHLQQGRETNKVQNEVSQYHQCDTEVSSTVNIPLTNTGKELPVYSCCPTNINEVVACEKAIKYQQPAQREYNTVKERITAPAPEVVSNIKVEMPSNHHNTTVNSWEYSGRQFKTPAQLKEIPAVNYYVGMPVIKCDGNRTDSNVMPNTDVYVPKLNSSEDVKFGYSQFNKPHALDLSIEESQYLRTQKTRRRKNNMPGESNARTRAPKRNSRNQAVNQNADPSNFYFPAEKRTHRKHVSR